MVALDVIIRGGIQVIADSHFKTFAAQHQGQSAATVIMVFKDENAFLAGHKFASTF
jgi:hypothetical protein